MWRTITLYGTRSPKVFAEYLLRSSGVLLDVTLALWSPRDPKSDWHMDDFLTVGKPLIQLLLPHLNRLQTFRVFTDDQVFLGYALKPLNCFEAPSLRTLQIETAMGSEDHGFIGLYDDDLAGCLLTLGLVSSGEELEKHKDGLRIFANMPSLRKLLLNNSFLCDTGTHRGVERMKIIRAGIFEPLVTPILLMSGCSMTLKHLRISQDAFGDLDEMPVEVILPALETLVLLGPTDILLEQSVLRELRAPNLHTLTIFLARGHPLDDPLCSDIWKVSDENEDSDAEEEWRLRDQLRFLGDSNPFPRLRHLVLAGEPALEDGTDQEATEEIFFTGQELFPNLTHLTLIDCFSPQLINGLIGSQTIESRFCFPAMQTLGIYTQEELGDGDMTVLVDAIESRLRSRTASSSNRPMLSNVRVRAPGQRGRRVRMIAELVELDITECSALEYQESVKSFIHI